MRNYNETDKILKDKLGQYDSGAPMHLFAGIEEGLGTAPEKKKRGGLWWTLGLFLLVSVGGGYLIFNNVNTSKASASVLTQSTQNPQELIDQKVTAAESVILTSNTTNTNVTTVKGNTTKGLTSEKIAVTKVIENKTNKSITGNTQKVNQSHLMSQELVTDKTNHQVINEEQLVSKSQQHPENTFFSKGKISTESPLTMGASTGRKSILTAQKMDKAFGQQVPALMNLNFKYNSEFQLPDIVKCGNKKDRKFDMNFTTSMDFFISPERSFRFLEYKSDDYADYAARRNETEKAYYSFSSGFRFNALADNGFAIRTGLVYSQINEIFEEQFLETRILTNPVNGDTIGFTQFLNDVTSFNRYKMVDVPLLIGYEMPMKRSTINVNAGVYVNVQATQKGALLDEEETKRNFTSGSGDYQVFRKNIGLSYFMSIGAAYELSPRYQFFFEPHLRYYPGSFAKKEYVLNQKYVTGGIMVGIRKQL